MFTTFLATAALLVGLYQPSVMSSHQISLNIRQPDQYVNQVFKENILLSLAYLDGKVSNSQNLNWDEVNKPFSYQFTLMPGETFAFHDSVLAKYKGSTVKTTGAHFNLQEGFLSDGYLVGDGVCHLASLFYWTGKDAGLLVEAPTNHDFANIPEISRENGVAIYNTPSDPNGSAMENLYITNNKTYPVTFVVVYDGNNLKVTAQQGY